jgi:hypothetical protein
MSDPAWPRDMAREAIDVWLPSRDPGEVNAVPDVLPRVLSHLLGQRLGPGHDEALAR